MRRTPLALVAIGSLVALVGCSSADDDGSTSADDIKAGTQQLVLGRVAHFKDFDVTVRGFEEREQNHFPVIGLDVKVCAVGAPNHVSWAPWALVTPVGDIGNGTVEPKDKLPWKANELYPRSADLAKGQCAEGVVPIFQTDGETVTAFRYKNSLNDAAVWKPSDAKQELRINQTAHFEAFDVTLRGFQQREQDGFPMMGLDVKVCAVGVPNKVGWGPWALVTPVGAIGFGTIEADEKLPWTPDKLYPRSAELAPGKCAEGIVPIAQPDGETVTAFRYKNTLGDRGTWK